ncbi:MAG: hypothetical protein JW783_05700 [Bacteroidales bacterium]|nr:hypothetical protein [Bacteroidales bacterium]MBN2748193.1 hypothetical protein [Bacteroidales bacterium]
MFFVGLFTSSVPYIMLAIVYSLCLLSASSPENVPAQGFFPEEKHIVLEHPQSYIEIDDAYINFYSTAPVKQNSIEPKAAPLLSGTIRQQLLAAHNTPTLRLIITSFINIPPPVIA